MTKPPSDPERLARRVLVAFSGDAEEWRRLEAAVELAARLRAELAGLFVEDDRLLRASRLPVARGLGGSTANAQDLDPHEIERMLKAAAARVEERLRQAAEARALPFSFGVTQGHPGLQALSHGAAMDAVLIGPHAGVAARREAEAPVAVLYDGSPVADGALELAAGLAVALQRPCLALIPARDIAEYATKLAHARTRFGGRALAGERIEAATAEALAEQVNRLGAAFLVLHAAQTEAEWVEALMRGLDCDLLLLR